MKLYYQEHGIEIWHGDCREWDGTADVMITDPPYGVGFSRKTSRHSNHMLASDPYADDAGDVAEMISKAIPRLLVKTPRALVFCGAKLMFNYPQPSAVGCVFSVSGAGLCSWGFQCMHPILYYGKDPYLQDGRGSRSNSFEGNYPGHSTHIDHPCPKPLRWMVWAVNRASRPGETVLDPFMGSGTTLRAAKDLGRKAIGIEIEEKYCEIAVQRLEQEVLFTPDPPQEHEQFPL